MAVLLFLEEVVLIYHMALGNVVLLIQLHWNQSVMVDLVKKNMIYLSILI